MADMFCEPFCALYIQEPTDQQRVWHILLGKSKVIRNIEGFPDLFLQACGDGPCWELNVDIWIVCPICE